MPCVLVVFLCVCRYKAHTNSGCAVQDETETATEEDVMLPLSETTEFIFSSGAGGRRTVMMLSSDGTFSGEFSDADMGDMEENYPNGTVYTCVFSGNFENMEKQFDGSYTMTLREITTEKEPGTEWIESGVRFIASGAYGLENTDFDTGATLSKEFVLYPPDTKVSELDEVFLSWWPERYTMGEMPETLGVYGIWNIDAKTGFFSQASDR